MTKFDKFAYDLIDAHGLTGYDQRDLDVVYARPLTLDEATARITERCPAWARVENIRPVPRITPNTTDFVIVNDEDHPDFGTIGVVIDLDLPTVHVVTFAADAPLRMSWPADALDKPTPDEIARCDSEYLQMMITAAQAAR